ncbi:unnamed protein product [marine sediment metagenome]|uniref:Uncharacterized protein n=1 Tax=marine sediment metagenome TaxID=412755 RepID=X1L9U1_9ZZZZ
MGSLRGAEPSFGGIVQAGKKMAPQFFGQEIKVTVSGEVKVPVSFCLGDREYIISAIIKAWPDYGVGQAH